MVWDHLFDKGSIKICGLAQGVNVDTHPEARGSSLELKVVPLPVPAAHLLIFVTLVVTLVVTLIDIDPVCHILVVEHQHREEFLIRWSRLPISAPSTSLHLSSGLV